MSQIEVNESLLGRNLRGIKGIDWSSHYVCGKFAVAANGLSLLRNVDSVSTFCKYLRIQ